MLAHRDRLRRMVEMRLDARIDISDVVPDAFREVAHLGLGTAIASVLVGAPGS